MEILTFLNFINNIHPQINKMANDEYSNYAENMNNLTERQKSSYLDEENQNKKEEFINNIKGENKINKYIIFIN